MVNQNMQIMTHCRMLNLPNLYPATGCCEVPLTILKYPMVSKISQHNIIEFIRKGSQCCQKKRIYKLQSNIVMVVLEVITKYQQRSNLDILLDSVCMYLFDRSATSINSNMSTTTSLVHLSPFFQMILKRKSFSCLFFSIFVCKCDDLQYSKVQYIKVLILTIDLRSLIGHLAIIL